MGGRGGEAEGEEGEGDGERGRGEEESKRTKVYTARGRGVKGQSGMARRTGLAQSGDGSHTRVHQPPAVMGEDEPPARE